MSSRPCSAVIFLAAVVAPLLLPPTPAAADIESVFVTNLPEVQTVDGAVTLAEPAPASRLVRLEQVVPPVGREEAALTSTGEAVRADGFTGAVLSLAVEVRGRLAAAGEVGVVLVPDEGPVLDALEQDGLLQLAREVVVPVRPGGSGRFAGEAPEVGLGFPRYRAFFYNTSDRAVAATLWVYLVN